MIFNAVHPDSAAQRSHILCAVPEKRGIYMDLAKILTQIDDYESQMAAGLDPVFHESNIGLSDTDVWK